MTAIGLFKLFSGPQFISYEMGPLNKLLCSNLKMIINFCIKMTSHVLYELDLARGHSNVNLKLLSTTSILSYGTDRQTDSDIYNGAFSGRVHNQTPLTAHGGSSPKSQKNAKSSVRCLTKS